MVKTPLDPKNSKASKAPQATKNGKSTTRSERKKPSKLTKESPTNLNSAMSAEANVAKSPSTNTKDTLRPVTPEDGTPSGRKSPPGVKDPPQVEDVDMDQNNDNASMTSNKSDATATADNRDLSQPQTTSRNNPYFALDPNAAAFNPNNNASANNGQQDSAPTETTRTNNKKVIMRNNDGLYTLKLSVKNNDNAAAEMKRSITEWFKEMKEVDPSFIIYDWKNNDMSRAISKSTEITSKVAAMRHFFSGVRPRSKAGPIWMNIHIGHDEFPSELDEGVDWWYKDNKARLYKKALQYKDSIQVSWLLYSHEKVDRDGLLERLTSKCNAMWNKNIPMALSWSQIRDGTFNKPNKPFDPNITYPYAIHVHCRTNDQEEVKAFMRQTYHSSQDHFPLMIRFRYVPVIDRSSTSHLKDKIRRLRSVQVDFLNSIDHATSWEIAALDYKSHSLSQTLREMIMSIPNDNNEPLFLSVNEDKNIGGFIFTFPSKYEQKARDLVTEFPAYLKYIFGEDIKKYLTIPAGERLEDAIWDPNLGHVVSSADIELEELAKEASNSSWIRLSTTDQNNNDDNIIDDHNKEVTNENEQNAPLFQFNNVNHIQRSDESVSTFGNFKATKNNNSDEASEGSISTMNSKSSIATRMTTVESKMNNMDSTLHQILTSLNRIHNDNGSAPLPVTGETQEGKTSESAALPESDAASAS